MATVSIVVPFFQAQDTLEAAIKSVVSQSFEDWELLLVDDGSTDGGLEIALGWAAHDSRIRVLTQRNQGRSVARNQGISAADGEWVAFLDADDELKANALETLLGLASDGADLVCGGYKDGENLNHVATCTSREMVEVIMSYPDPSYRELAFPYWNGLVERTVWGKLYRMRIVEKGSVQFASALAFGEDALFNIAYLLNATSVCVTDSVVYEYVYRDTSTTHSFSEKDFRHLKRFVATAVDCLDEPVGNGSISTEEYAQFISNEVMGLFKKAVRCGNYDIAALGFNEIMRDSDLYSFARRYKSASPVGTRINRFYILLMRHRLSLVALSLERFLVKRIR